MISKTLEMWSKETFDYGLFYYDKYTEGLESCERKYITDFYVKVAASNWKLQEVLQHLIKYGALITTKCPACRFKYSEHIKNIDETYLKYKKFIDQAQQNSKNNTAK